MASLIYYENTLPLVGITSVMSAIHSIITHRGTRVDMVDRPNWGMTCYMDNTIQSCEVDEEIYHETLVHPVMQCTTMRKRVMIIGGGEGATLREVLKWPDVEQVDMYEWDKDIVDLFKTKYPQWAREAWTDPRLTLHYEDIFEAIQVHPITPYNIVIVDLFDYSEETKDAWRVLMYHLPFWANGSIVIYAGMRNVHNRQQSYHILSQMIREYHDIYIIPYRVYIPSFMGESTFLLLKLRATPIIFDQTIVSHITKEVWNSYKTFNW